MANESSREELPEKVWLPWFREGPYLVRHQHLVARDPEEPALCPVPIGRQMRGLPKATLQELRASLRQGLFEVVQQLADRLAKGRPYRLAVRELQEQGRDPAEVEEALMALCRGGLVVVFFRNRNRAGVRWEARHTELTNWGRALLISLDAVSLPARSAARASVNGSARRGAARRAARGRSGQAPASGPAQAGAPSTNGQA